MQHSSEKEERLKDKSKGINSDLDTLCQEHEKFYKTRQSSCTISALNNKMQLTVHTGCYSRVRD